jgi:hypothetical protein
MNSEYYDIIIIGSGMSGLYSAYNIKKMSPQTSFLILEKHKKQWIGGRTSNDTFYGEEIVTGAGIGRKRKDKLLFKLMNDLKLPSHEYMVKPQYSKCFHPIDINNIMELLRKKSKTIDFSNKNINPTFSEYAKSILGENEYKKFILSAGYTDYEKEDFLETLYYYGMEDNTCCWKAFTVEWKKLVLKLYDIIGHDKFRFSSNVAKIDKIQDSPCVNIVQTETGKQYYCNKIIMATTITSIRKLLPKYPIYNKLYLQNIISEMTVEEKNKILTSDFDTLWRELCPSVRRPWRSGLLT